MNFNQDQEHKNSFALLFNSYEHIEKRFKSFFKGGLCKHTMLNDREEKQVASMLLSVGELGAQLVKLQTKGIQAIVIANTTEEAIAQHMNLIKLVPQGILICPTCLDQAILTCEENLIALKDLREATKQYAT